MFKILSGDFDKKAVFVIDKISETKGVKLQQHFYIMLKV